MWCHSSKIITSYKYLGTNFDDHFKFDVNTEAIEAGATENSPSPQTKFLELILCCLYQSFF